MHRLVHFKCDDEACAKVCLSQATWAALQGHAALAQPSSPRARLQTPHRTDWTCHSVCGSPSSSKSQAPRRLGVCGTAR
eukprot:886356-Rhodomonas_salina.2